MLGVIVLGGRGTRLLPLTETVNKHFLPVYDKPMFYYPLSVLLLAGCRQIVVVSNKADKEQFQKSIQSINLQNVKFLFHNQDRPLGIVDALASAKESLEGKEFWLALGDNLLFGPGLGRSLASLKSGGKCRVFSTTSRHPERFGSVRLNQQGHPIEIREKADKEFSNQVLAGLYLFPSQTFEVIPEVKTSVRNELEISDLLSVFLSRQELVLTRLPLGTTWIDLGTFDDLQDASTIIRLHQSHSGGKLGDPSAALNASESQKQVQKREVM